MARNIKFSLILKDGYEVEKDIEELRKHFDLERVIHYFQMGGLQRWLRINGYREEAVQMTDLQDDETLAKKICEILGVEMPDRVVAEADIEEIKEKNARLRRLRQYTTDEKILALAEKAVFSQKELDELIDDGVDEIVLCDASFTIPLQERGMKYYGAGRAVAVIKSEENVDFAARHIEFYQVSFDEKYQQIVDDEQKQEVQTKAEEAHQQPKSIGGENDEKQTVDWYRKAAEAGIVKGMKGIAGCYAEGKGVAQDDEKALFWYRKAAEAGDASAMLLAGDCLRDNGHAAEARDWYEKAAGEGEDEIKGSAFSRLGAMYSDGLLGRDGAEKAVRYFEKSAEFGCAIGMYNLAYHYENGKGVAKDKIRAASYYKLVAESGNVFWRGEALNSLGRMYIDGAFGKKGDPRGVEYFKKAADLGCASGVANLAFFYESGDKKRAIRLYQQAAQAGSEFARERLEKLKKDDVPVVKKNDSSLVKGILGFFS